MVAKRSSRKVLRKPRKKPKGACVFCRAKTDPDYKSIDTLSKFVTDRAKIVAGNRSGVCAKHQRKLAQAIKRARHLGLLPYTVRV